MANRMVGTERSARLLSQMHPNFFPKCPNTGICLIILFLLKTNFTEKIVDFSGIQTLIGQVVWEHTDHLTTSTTDFYT